MNKGMAIAACGAIGVVALLAWWLSREESAELPDDAGPGVAVPDGPAKPLHGSADVASAWGDVMSIVGGFAGPETTMVAKARSAVGKGITYKLGHGGKFPTDLLPTRDGMCDCSGFVSWVCGFNRSGKGTLGTDIFTGSIYNDANGPQKLFRKLPGPQPGCIVVYPAQGPGKFGHTAIVVDTGKMTIVDCSDGKGGITEHSGSYFLKAKGVTFCVPVAA